MKLSSRILCELERTLIDKLRFSFNGLSLHELRMLRIGDPVRFQVSIDNLTGLPLRNVHGTVRSGDRTRFGETPFFIKRLAPEECVTIASVAGIFDGPVDASLVDVGLASIEVSSRIDLSEIVFEEWDRAVVIAPTMSSREQPAARPQRASMRGTGLPLSV